MAHTDEWVAEQVGVLGGGEYQKLSTYTGTKVKMKMRHLTCGNNFEINWDNFRQGRRCPFCAGKRWNTKSVNEFVRVHGDSEYEVFGEYLGVREKMTFHHKKCGKTYATTFDSFKRGHRCNFCSTIVGSMKQALSDEEVSKEFRKLSDGEFIKLSKYKSNAIKLKVYHVECGMSFEVKWENFKNGNRCSHCKGARISKTQTYSNSDIDNILFGLHEGRFKRVSDYIGAKKVITLKDAKCGATFTEKWDQFRTDPRCKICERDYSSAKAYSQDDVDRILSQEGYVRLTPYSNTYNSVRIRHEKCGWEYDTRMQNFNSGRRCPKCGGTKPYTQKEVEAIVSEVTNGEFEVAGRYTRSRDKLTIKHNKCGRTFETEFYNFKNKKRCYFCHRSSGEKVITEMFEKLKINFKPQFTFPDCRNKIPLPFDFAVMDDKNSPMLLVEYDGVQHFKAVDFFGGEVEFLQTKIRDEIKTQYCVDHNIPLLRIPYWEFENIETILDVELQKITN